MELQNSDTQSSIPLASVPTMDFEERARQSRISTELSQFHWTLGKRYWKCSFKSFNATTPAMQAAVNAVLDYGRNMADNLESGRNLILRGPVGTGKDHLMAALAHRAIVNGVRGIEWVRAADLLADIGQRMFDRDDPWTPKELSRAKILCISDLVSKDKPLTDHQQEQLWRIVDSRYSGLRPTWATLNIANRAELETCIGAPTVDRLLEGAVVVRCEWESYRQRKADDAKHERENATVTPVEVTR
jgi:DNA replication protein DnaC